MVSPEFDPDLAKKVHDTCSNEIKENRKMITRKITTVDRLHIRAAPWGGAREPRLLSVLRRLNPIEVRKKDQYTKVEEKCHMDKA